MPDAAPAGGRGFACSGALDPEEIAATAAAAEQLGYTTFWITILRGLTDPARVLAAALEATAALEVGLGLVPLDAFPGAAVGARLAGVPRRAVVGLGVGQHHRGAETFWRAEAGAFQAAAPEVRTAVGGYGERVLGAGGGLADAVLLNWMTPERVGWAMRQVDAGAARAERRPPRPVYLYVPVAAGGGAGERIAQVMRDFAQYEYHRRHQRAMAATEPVGIAIEGTAAVPALPDYGDGVVPVLNPVGETTRAERKRLLELLRPAGS